MAQKAPINGCFMYDDRQQSSGEGQSNLKSNRSGKSDVSSMMGEKVKRDESSLGLKGFKELKECKELTSSESQRFRQANKNAPETNAVFWCLAQEALDPMQYLFICGMQSEKIVDYLTKF